MEDVLGASFPGIPGALTGRGAHVGWGVTVVGYDVTDLYVETFTDATHGGTAASTHAHASRTDANGTVFYGLPVSGFEAENFVNGNLGGVLANYSGVYRHRNSRSVILGS